MSTNQAEVPTMPTEIANLKKGDTFEFWNWRLGEMKPVKAHTDPVFQSEYYDGLWKDAVKYILTSA